MIYHFLGLELDEEAFEIRRNGSPVLTQRKAFDFVHFLLRNRDRVVTRDELIDALWMGASRGLSTIPQCAATVRRALGEDMDPQAVVQTVRGRGYRFVAAVEEVDPAPPDFTAESPGDASGRAGVSATRLVGRQEVLAALRGALQESLSGETRVVLLTGEPGIGKTRLVEELCSEATNEGSMVLTGRCHEVDGVPAFWPWIEMIREWNHGNDFETLPEDLKTEARYFATWRPELVGGASDPVSEMGDGAEARFRGFDRSARGLQKFSTHQHLVLVLEDLHWADPASLDLLRFLAAQLHGERILLLGTCREDELPFAPELSETLGELGRESTFRRFAIKGLEGEHVTELLLQIVGKDISPALTELVVSMTEGNPFFVVELARILDAEEGELRVELPVSISAAIGRRLGKLTAESRELLGFASIIGREFSATLLWEITTQEYVLNLDHLEEAVAAGVVEPVRSTPDSYHFTHTLIRETLYRGIHEPNRANSHRAVAEALERLHGKSTTLPVEALAHHWYAAVATGALEKAAEYCNRAGLQALSRLAFEEAALHLKRALEIADLRPSPVDSERCELLLHLGHAEWNAGDDEAARVSFSRAALLARRTGSAEKFARAGIGYYGFELGHTEDPTTRALLKEAADWLDDDSPALRAQVLTMLSFVSPYAERIETRESMSVEALELARSCGNIEALRGAFSGRQWATPPPMFIEQRIEWEKECREWGKRLDDPWLSSLGNDVVVPLSQGDREGLVHALKESARLASVSEHRSAQFVYTLQQAGFALLEGRFNDSTDLIGKIIEAGKGCSSWAPESYYAYLFLESWQRGELHQPGQNWSLFFEGLIAGLPGRETIGHAAIALLSAFDGDQDTALKELDWLAASIGPDFREVPQNENWISAMYLMSEAIERFDAKPHAEKLSAALEPYADLMVCHPAHRLPGGSIATMLGLLSATLGDFDGGIAHFEAGYAMEKALGAKPVMLRNRAGLAGLLLRRRARGDRSRAQTLMEETIKGCNRLGISPRQKYIIPLERLL